MNSTVQSASETRTADLDILNEILRGETSALETYSSAMKKFIDEPTLSELSRIYGEHQQSVTRLRERVVQLGGQTSEGSGWWGTFTTSLIGAGKLLGPQIVLATLKQGEGHGASEYTRAIENQDISTDLKPLFSDELAKCHMHISTLDILIAKIEAK